VELAAVVPPAEAAPLAAAPAAEPPAPVTVARATAPEPPPPSPHAEAAAEVERRLSAVDARQSARAAVTALLAAWQTRPLAADETEVPADLERVAWRRGLETLRLNGNRSMLQLLDLPAMVELVLGVQGPRYATLVGMEGERVLLSVDGNPMTVDLGFLDRFWFGQAYVLWRDFEGLGATFGKEGRGVQVARLQTVLRRAGLYDGAPTGEFDDATESAVLEFQRSRRLLVDGRVGRLTRIVLYAATGGYARPTLIPTAGGES
jgi:hypothetical protein